MTSDLWLAVDPGETTGWSIWDGRELLEAGQTELALFRDDVWDAFSPGGFSGGPFEGIQKLVVEEFRLYPWVINEGGLDFDELRTSRLIGGLELIARMAGWGFVFQPATIKDASQVSGAREMFSHPLYPNRHANDSIMHGWYYVLTHYMGMTFLLPSGEATHVDPARVVSAVEAGAPPA